MVRETGLGLPLHFWAGVTGRESVATHEYHAGRCSRGAVGPRVRVPRAGARRRASVFRRRRRSGHRRDPPPRPGDHPDALLLGRRGHSSSRSRGPASRCSAAASRSTAPWSSTGQRPRVIAASAISAVASRFEHNDGDLGAIYAGFSEARRGGEPELVRATESYARLAGLCLAQSGVARLGPHGPEPRRAHRLLSYGGVCRRVQGRGGALATPRAPALLLLHRPRRLQADQRRARAPARQRGPERGRLGASEGGAPL